MQESGLGHEQVSRAERKLAVGGNFLRNIAEPGLRRPANLALVGDQVQQGLEQNRFASSVRPDDGNAIALVNLEAQAMNDLTGPEAETQVGDRKQRVRHGQVRPRIRSENPASEGSQ